MAQNKSGIHIKLSKTTLVSVTKRRKGTDRNCPKRLKENVGYEVPVNFRVKHETVPAFIQTSKTLVGTDTKLQPVMVAYICNQRTQDDETKGSHIRG